MIRQILFDFDGVIVDSMAVRDFGFRAIVSEYDEDLVEGFIRYHRYNAGLSRYVKIRYFYENMLGQSVSEERVQQLAAQFSAIMREKLVDPAIKIKESCDFLEQIHQHYDLHIVSGSDEKELNYLCQQLDLDDYFVTIEGSPTPKNALVSGIMETYAYKPDEVILIGDSINDYDAAVHNSIGFYGYNNQSLSDKGLGYIQSFRQPPFVLNV